MKGGVNIISHTGMESLAGKFIRDILAKDNYGPNAGKGGFLTGGNVIICESRGLQQYLQKMCADTGERNIWTALPFKPLAGLLMQYAYNLSPREQKKDEGENVFNEINLIWAVYRLLEGKKKTFNFASEIASLFGAYQIYRPELIDAWNRGEAYSLPDEDAGFRNNERWQRELWGKIKSRHKNEQDISQLYHYMEKELKSTDCDNLLLPRRIFVFAPLSIAPVHLSALTLLAQAGCTVNVYHLAVSGEYADFSPGAGKTALLRKKSWNENKIVNERNLYWDLGNRLIANLGRSSQTLYEQFLEYADIVKTGGAAPEENRRKKNKTLLEKIQSDIRSDSNEKSKTLKDGSIVINNCFSPLREVETLCDFILDAFSCRDLTSADIAVVSPNIENYASAIESVFGRNNIPCRIADRDIKKYDKTVQLLHLLFGQAGGRYEAADIAALFEYSMFVQGISLEGQTGLLEKWIGENAVRYGLENSAPLPNYSFEGGFEQLAAGFFMLAEKGFSETGAYCYPDIEGSSARILGDFACFVKALEGFEREITQEKSIEEWDCFFRENLRAFFGSDEIDFNEDIDNPYQKITGAWDSLKKEMLTGFGGDLSQKVDFSVIKNALPQKLETNAKSSYSLTGRVSFSNIETIRTVPYKVLCCIGMNGKEFPRQMKNKEINLMADYKPGDRDIANEDRLMFLETICSAGETLYISWTGQSEKTGEEIEPSGAVIMLLKTIEEQYGIQPGEMTVKHPLQPFSKKYFNGTLSTYDRRWTLESGEQGMGSGNSIWQWEITPGEDNDADNKQNINELYRILSDAPKYFLRTICNIELPEDAALLENTEPFVIGSGLDQWKLADLILNREDYHNEIRIEQMRGGLPSGMFADKLIDCAVKETEELKESAKGEKPGTFWIYPSNDKGKYRLKHWLYHLDLNLKCENQDTKMFLKDSVIALRGMPKEKAENILACLRDLADTLKTKMQPIFPDAAWEFLSNTGNAAREFSLEERLSNAWGKIAGNGYISQGILYSQYARMAVGEAESFEDLGIENAFIDCSTRLFENYNGEDIT